MPSFKVLKPFRHLETWHQVGAVAEIREDLVEGLTKEKFIGPVTSAPLQAAVAPKK
jgi:hypothetical protein